MGSSTDIEEIKLKVLEAFKEIEKRENKVALITGITGQDGYYLAKFLLEKGYKVYGMYRRSSLEIEERIFSLRKKIKLIEGDMTDIPSIINALKKINPDEVYNLAAQSFVPASWSQPISTGEITGMGVLKILEAIRIVNPKIRFYQASSSEMFGKVKESPQNENTSFYPRSIYGISKVLAYWATINYRESYGIHASNGILFNHESPKRGKQFVTRKISHSVAKIKRGLQDCLELGNLDAKRDWGFAGDYVVAMWKMLQKDSPGDYIISTGEMHSVREFVEEAFKIVDMQITWEGNGDNEIGKCGEKIVVKVNPNFRRLAEVDHLCGNPEKARRELDWTPKIKFKELVKMMVEADLKRIDYGESKLIELNNLD